MKKLLAVGSALLLGNGLQAAPDATLKFGGERIGVPPLSMRESISKGTSPFGGPQFGTRLPAYSEPNGLHDGGWKLLTPPRDPNLDSLRAARAARAPRVSREFGMPMLEPSDTVDYTLKIVPPDPSIDFKMVVKDPSPRLPAASAK